MHFPRVLAITKRLPIACDTQSLLYGAGIELVTATSMAAARSCINAMRVKGVIVCLGSWTEEELANINAELAADFPELVVVFRCPGCTGCAGPEIEKFQLTKLIIAINPAA